MADNDVKQIKSNFSVEVVLLMLASTKVTTPKLWDRWIDSYESKIGRLVLVPDLSKTDNLSCSKKKNWRIHILQTKTAWGSIGLVAALCEGLQVALKVFPSATTFYLVSGDTIPISPVTELLKEKRLNKTVLCGGYNHFVKATTSVLTALQKDRSPTSFWHAQWLVLSRKDAEILAFSSSKLGDYLRENDPENPENHGYFDRRDPLDILADVKDLENLRCKILALIPIAEQNKRQAWKNLIDWKIMMTKRENWGAYIPYDEYLPGWILTSSKTSKVRFDNHPELCPLMAQFKPERGAPSPVTWKSYDKAEFPESVARDFHYALDDKNMEKNTLHFLDELTSLKAKIQQQNPNRRALFFRKVSSEVDEKLADPQEKPPWEWCKDHKDNQKEDLGYYYQQWFDVEKKRLEEEKAEKESQKNFRYNLMMDKARFLAEYLVDEFKPPTQKRIYMTKTPMEQIELDIPYFEQVSNRVGTFWKLVKQMTDQQGIPHPFLHNILESYTDVYIDMI